MADAIEIVPGRGLGELLFGATFSDTRLILGDPDDVGKSEFEDEDTGEVTTSEMWTYGEMGIKLHFDEMDNFRLGMFSVEDDMFTLMGEKLIGCEKSKVMDFLKGLNFGEFEDERVVFDEDLDAPVSDIVSFMDKEIEFWFADGTLTEIQWSPLWADDETPIWPEK